MLDPRTRLDQQGYHSALPDIHTTASRLRLRFLHLALQFSATFAAVLLLGPGTVGAETAELVALTLEAASLCKSEADSKPVLAELLSAVSQEYGSGHDAAVLVRLYAGGSEPGDGESSDREIDAALGRAFKKLRACTPAPAQKTLDKITYTQHLDTGFKLYERALYRDALEAAQLAKETIESAAPPAEQIKIHDLLAKVLLQLGKSDLAIREAMVAEELASQIGATTYRIDYARLYAQAGDLERAQGQLNRLKDIDLQPADQAELDEVRGYTSLLLGSPREAMVHLDRALMGHRQIYGANHPSTAAVLQLQADAFRLAGDFPAATSAYRETLKLRRETLGPKHAETARTQNSIGVLLADIGDWSNADGAFMAALDSLRETQGEMSVDTIRVRTNLALAKWGAHKNRQAADEYAAAVTDLQSVLGADHPIVAAVVRNLAVMEFNLGNAERAEELLNGVLTAQIRVLGNSHPDLAPTRLARGRLLAQRGQLVEAAAEIDSAIDVLLVALGPEHPLVARARTTRAQTALAMGDQTTALSSAVAAARSIVTFTQRTLGAISDRQRALLSQDSNQVIGALLSVSDVDAKDLFVALLPHRDSVLRSIAARRASERGDGRFATELTELRKRYVAAVLGHGPDTAQRVQALAQAIEGLEVLQSDGKEEANLEPREVLERACQQLPSDAALIKIIAYDRTLKGDATETVSAYTALVVRGDGCEVTRVELGEGAKLTQSAEKFASAMRDQLMDQPIARLELGEAVLVPLAPLLAGVKRWHVVPDGALWGIPLGVLPDPEDPNHYLLERVTVGYLTSTYELAESKRRESNSKQLAAELRRSLLIGAPDFGGGENGGPVVLTDAGPCQLQPFEMLPATESELQDIAGLLSESTTVTGAEVTKKRLEQELKSQPWLVHFATHAYFAGTGGCGAQTDSDELREKAISPNPLLLSGIVLAGANRPDRVDAESESGILTAYEVAGLDMRSAGLVVLSACDTGTGLALRGQEVQGLRWGFRAAGAQAMVTSLWRSNDAATRRMMSSFYTALASEDLPADSLRGAEALRSAKLQQLQDEARLGIRRPLIWANFIFSGVM